MNKWEQPKPVDWESLIELHIIDTDMTAKSGRFLRFALTENYSLFISPHFHEFLADKYGVDSCKTLTEGNLTFEDDGKIRITFKHPMYQKSPTFIGTVEELHQLQEAIKNLLLTKIKEQEPRLKQNKSKKASSQAVSP